MTVSKKRNRFFLLAALAVCLLIGAGRVQAAVKPWSKKGNYFYNAVGKKIPWALTRGVDVSVWEESINWAQVAKSDVDFAFVRISHGLSIQDTRYDYNMSQAQAAGIPLGTYVYSTATSFHAALAEAQMAIEKMQGYKISYPVVLDLEDASVGSKSKDMVARLALTFCDEIRKAGYTPMIYCNQNWYNNHINWDILTGVDLWLASFDDTSTGPDQDIYPYTIWQATAGDEIAGHVSTKSLISGINSNVDVDFGRVDYTKLIPPRTYALSSYVPASSPLFPDEGWSAVGQDQYYYRDGQKVTGWNQIDGKYYCFNKQGVMRIKELIRSSKGNLYYVGSDGARVKNQRVKVSGKYYYFNAAGRAVKGYWQMKGKNYYFSPDTFQMIRSKKIVTGKKISYAQKNGTLVTNKFYTLTEGKEKNTYYFDEKGIALLGLQKIDGKRYYFYPSAQKRGIMARDVTITSKGGRHYEFGADGVLTRIS